MKPARREAYFSCLEITVEHSVNFIELLCRAVLGPCGRYTNFSNLDSSKLSWIKAHNYNSDANNLIESGIYLFNTNAVSNLPTYAADNANIVVVFNYNSACALQIYIGFMGSNAVGVYMRGLWSGKWENWLQLG